MHRFTRGKSSQLPVGMAVASLAVGLLAMLACPARAELLLGDSFAYPNGNLNGNNGGFSADAGNLWTGPWVADTVLSTGAVMQVSSQAVLSGNAGGGGADADRAFALAQGSGGVRYFSMEMSKYGSEGDYQISWGFPGAGARIGLNNDRFYAELGAASATDTTFATDVGVRHRLVGKLELNASGGEQLTVWRDPSSPLDAPILQLTAETSATTLGSGVNLNANYRTNGSKLWDDLRVGASFRDVARTALLLEENFTYANGELHGRNGGFAAPGASWNTAWTDADYGHLSGKEYETVNEQAYMNQSGALSHGGDPRTITREFTTGVAPGTTMYFTMKMGKNDGEGLYSLEYRFPDANARIGIVDNKFSIGLGSASAVTPTALVEAGKHDVLVGRLEFNVDGTNERLTVWRNPNFEVEAPLLQVTADIGVTTLGDEVSLYYGTGSDGPKQWDDLRIATTFQAADLLRVDVGSNGSPLEGGFERWDLGTGGANNVVSQMTFRQLGGFTATLDEVTGSGGGISVRDRGATTGTLPSLKRDGLFGSAGVRLTFDDLTWGVYELTTYHHDLLTVRPGLDIFIGDAATPVATINQVNDGAPPASATFRFETDASGQAYFRFTNQSGVTFFSGFELSPVQYLPEPSTLTLLALGGVALMRRRRRLRRG